MYQVNSLPVQRVYAKTAVRLCEKLGYIKSSDFQWSRCWTNHETYFTYIEQLLMFTVELTFWSGSSSQHINLHKQVAAMCSFKLFLCKSVWRNFTFPWEGTWWDVSWVHSFFSHIRAYVCFLYFILIIHLITMMFGWLF